jgi:outer membrane immunogenic protein
MGVSNAPHSTAECISNHETASNSFVRRTRSQARLRYSRHRQVAETGIWGIMKKIVLATVLAALGSASALAADLGPRAYTKAPMMTAPVSSWQGFYIGGNVGYGWGDGKTDFSFLPSPDDFTVANTSLNSNPQGVIGGAQIGYNWQSGVVVAGFETDIQGSGIKGNAAKGALLFPSLAPVPNSLLTTNEKLSWFGTARGRLGITVTPAFLLYATGGFAYGQVENSANTQFNNGADNFVANVSKTRVGWTAGAGGEWMFAPGWSAKFEYLYMDLGKSSAVADDAPVPDPPFQVGYRWRTQENIVRAGVNYHF